MTEGTDTSTDTSAVSVGPITQTGEAGPHLPGRVGEAISVVGAWTDLDGGGVAHETVIVDAFGALAGANVRQNFGQTTVHTDIDECGAGGMIRRATDGDCGGITSRVVVERTL